MITWGILYCSPYVAILCKNLFCSPVGLRNFEITDFLLQYLTVFIVLCQSSEVECTAWAVS